MKILFLTTEYPPKVGNTSSFVFNTCRYWPNQQDEIIVYAPKFNGDLDFDKQNSWKTIRKKIGRLKTCWQIFWITKKQKFDMIYVYDISFYSNTLYWVNKILKTSYQVFLNDRDYKIANKNKTSRIKLRKICGSAKQVTVNSMHLQNKFQELLVDFADKLKVVYYCVGQQFFENVMEKEIQELTSLLALNGKKVILSVAQIEEGEGYMRFLHILPRIIKKVPNLVWVIIGYGPKKQTLVDFIQKQNLQNSIRFIGQIDYKKMPMYYRIADLFVLLLHPDNESKQDSGRTALLEASASGLPVVVGQIGGIEELVQNLKTGLIVDVSQEQVVINSMIELLNNQKYSEQMGQFGKEWAKENFRCDMQTQKYPCI
ncbi:MAG: glycosyltransferase family 4 protein [bacterium]